MGPKDLVKTWVVAFNQADVAALAGSLFDGVASQFTSKEQ